MWLSSVLVWCLASLAQIRAQTNNKTQGMYTFEFVFVYALRPKILQVMYQDDLKILKFLKESH